MKGAELSPPPLKSDWKLEASLFRLLHDSHSLIRTPDEEDERQIKADPQLSFYITENEEVPVVGLDSGSLLVNTYKIKLSKC